MIANNTNKRSAIMSTTGSGMLQTVLHTVAESHCCAAARSMPFARAMISCMCVLRLSLQSQYSIKDGYFDKKKD